MNISLGWEDGKTPNAQGEPPSKLLCEGWFKLQTILEGYELAMSLEHGDL
jgi:hypothetical protein